MGALCVLALSLCGQAPTALGAVTGGARAEPCNTPGRLLAANEVAALSLRLVDESQRNGYYGCVRGGRARFIQGAPDDSYFDVFKQRPVLRGRFVMIGYQTCDQGGCYGGSRAFPLDGRAPSVLPFDQPNERRLVQIDGTARGTLIALSSLANAYELRTMDRHHHATLLDTGAIEPGSVAVVGNRIFWIKDGTPRTAAV